MWKAATRCAKEKLLIVSMGNVAGSGGYYVSIPGDQIFADEATITASIGVVGGKLVWRELWQDKLGVTTTSFDRGKHAGLWTMNEGWTESERAWIKKYMTEVYDQFKGRIMTSRGDRLKKDLESIAGGRVYTGKQALELGLVDQLGGLSDAIEYTAKRAGLDDYDVYVFPKPKNPLEEVFASLTGKEPEDEWEFSLGGKTNLESLLSTHPLLRAAAPLLRELAPARMDALGRAFGQLMTIETEHVGCFMPCDLNIR
jgi:protease-4